MKIDFISNACLIKLITNIQHANALDDKNQVIKHVNKFLEMYRLYFIWRLSI